MVEGQIIQLSDNKKYYVHDTVNFMGNKYVYLIKVNLTEDDFENETLILKENIISGVYSLTDLSPQELLAIRSNI